MGQSPEFQEPPACAPLTVQKSHSCCRTSKGTGKNGALLELKKEKPRCHPYYQRRVAEQLVQVSLSAQKSFFFLKRN